MSKARYHSLNTSQKVSSIEYDFTHHYDKHTNSDGTIGDSPSTHQGIDIAIEG